MLVQQNEAGVASAELVGSTACKSDPAEVLIDISIGALNWQQAPNLGDLRGVLARTGSLEPRHRQLIVRQALVLLEQNYVHLPAKRALYAIDPVQRLKLLLRKLETEEDPRSALSQSSPPDQQRMSDTELHRELLEVFSSLRDPHTRYYLPAAFHGKIAFLPFMVEDIEEDGLRKYIVSKLAHDFRHETFAAGVEILYWNGMSMDGAVRSHARQCTGSNPEARHAEALITLTLRALHEAPAPDEDWVVVGYRTQDGQKLEEKLDWKVGADPKRQISMSACDGDNEMNPGLATMKLAHRELFAPRGPERQKDKAPGLATDYPGVFAAREVKTEYGTFGYLRIWNFELKEDTFVNEFIRLIEQLPQEGLIIDIRENPGGKMSAAEYVLQTLTARRIEPEPLQFINTPLNLRICSAPRPDQEMPDLKRWVEAIQEGLQTGAVYSAAFPKSSVEESNKHGRKYFGPVVLITDALSYSAADIFAAGFQDHEIGKILGTDWRTGGGGANRWEYYERYRRYNLAAYRKLPDGVTFTVASRRALRVGHRAGAVLEDFGVKSDKYHAMTRNDVMHGNRDLIEKAAGWLSGKEPT